MQEIYLDLTKGVSGDMFVAASYGFMNDEMRSSFDKRIKRTLEAKSIRVASRIGRYEDMDGYSIIAESDEMDRARSSEEAREIVDSISDEMQLSEPSRSYSARVLSDIIEAEADAHNVKRENVHLHEIGRIKGLFNIVAAGLCMDILDLHSSVLISSFISIGEGTVQGSHGIMTIPTPATAFLLKGLRFRYGPFIGEMATPAGISIIKNTIKHQRDALPERKVREGIGFGTRMFGSSPGYVRMFTTASNKKGDSNE